MSGKFRDKETGVEGYLRANRYIEYQIEDEKGVPINGSFKTLSELLEKWEEIEEEPKKFWCVLDNGNIAMSDDTDEDLEANKEIGNYFETREEAEKAVEKLKAWERLKDKGFRFEYWAYKMDEPEIENHTHFKIVGVCEDGVRFDDLDLLFGGEE